MQFARKPLTFLEHSQLLPTLLQGIAMAFFFIPLQAIALGGLPPARLPSATGLNNFVRITAGAIGTSVYTTLWDSRASLHHAQLAEHVAETNPAAMQAIAQLRGAGYTREQALALINRMIDQQAHTRAADDIFYVSAVLFLGLIGLHAMSLGAPVTPGAVRGVEIVRMVGFCALVIVLTLRSTTAFSLVGRNAELDDELTRANRAAAAQAGFLAAILGGVAALIASLFVALSATEVLPFVLMLGAFVAAVRFARLEKRGEADA